LCAIVIQGDVSDVIDNMLCSRLRLYRDNGSRIADFLPVDLYDYAAVLSGYRQQLRKCTIHLVMAALGEAFQSTALKSVGRLDDRVRHRSSCSLSISLTDAKGLCVRTLEIANLNISASHFTELQDDHSDDAD
jgi:hypothetical protein